MKLVVTAFVTLDGVVALLGLLLAIFALAGATERRSFFMFNPIRRLMTWLGLAVALVLVPCSAVPPGSPTHHSGTPTLHHSVSP